MKKIIGFLCFSLFFVTCQKEKDNSSTLPVTVDASLPPKINDPFVSNRLIVGREIFPQYAIDYHFNYPGLDQTKHQLQLDLSLLKNNYYANLQSNFSAQKILYTFGIDYTQLCPVFDPNVFVMMNSLPSNGLFNFTISQDLSNFPETGHQIAFYLFAGNIYYNIPLYKKLEFSPLVNNQYGYTHAPVSLDISNYTSTTLNYSRNIPLSQIELGGAYTLEYRFFYTGSSIPIPRESVDVIIDNNGNIVLPRGGSVVLDTSIVFDIFDGVTFQAYLVRKSALQAVDPNPQLNKTIALKDFTIVFL